MESIETIIRLVAAMVTASLAPAPQYVDPGAELRMPLLSQAAAPAEELAGVARWQQVDEVPSDLPDGATQPDDELLDADQNGAGQSESGDEPLDAPLDDELADDELVADDEFADDELLEDDLASQQMGDEFDDAQAEDEPLDEPLDDDFGDEEFIDDFADDELIDEPTFADEPLDAPPGDAFAGGPSTVSTRPATTSGTVALPPGFGSGETIVRNPPAGAEAAQVPTDCDAVVQNGRAVVGVGCGGGADDAPWWMPLVGQPQPAGAPSTVSGQAADFPFNQAGPPPGFPFDDSSPFGSDQGGILIAGQAGDEQVREGRVELNGDPVIERSAATADRIYERDDQSDRDQKREGERAEAIREERSKIVAGLPTGHQAAQSSRPGLRTATQPASARKSNRAKASAGQKAAPNRSGAKLNPCQNAKRLAQNPRSARNGKQLAKAKANCRQFKKTQRQADR